MDFTSLLPLAGSLARAGLPALATILGTVVPPPFDLLVAPAFAIIRTAIGLPDTATPADVQAKVDADPTDAQAKLKAIDDAHASAAAEVQSYLADIQNARSTDVELVKANSIIAWGPPILGVFNMTLFASVVFWLLSGHTADNPLAQTIVGAILGSYATTQAFFLGSSQSAKTRTDQALSYAAKVLPTSRTGKRA